MALKRLLSDLIYLIFPTVCPVCYTPLLKNEKHLCTKCLLDLPRTNFHSIPGNLIEKSFWGKVKIESASSFLYYQKKEVTQRILKLIKYQSASDLAIYLGELFAVDLLLSDFANADCIVPVPLHKNKLSKRGYNQAELIAQGISNILEIPVDKEAVIRVKDTVSQTTYNKLERWENIQDAFQLHPSFDKSNKHIILVDDVLTTGATVETIATMLIEHSNEVSIATLAYAAPI